MYEVTIGQDMSCYATIQVPEDTPLTREALAKIVNHVLDNQEWDGEEVCMEEDWSSVCATRVVSVRDEKGHHLVEGMAIEPVYYDAGLDLMGWLHERVPLKSVINSAVQAGLIDDPVMETHRGTFKLPGCEAVEVEFECRKGATSEEKDLAFFEALAQIGTVNYAVIEGVHHGV